MTAKPRADVLAPEMALSHFLNFSRAAAALLVLLFHIRSTLVVPYEALEAHSWLARIVFAVSTFGHEGVIIFFVLSGYLVGGAVLRLDVTSPRELSAYSIDRSVRIGPVLIAATALAAVLQHVAPLPGCADTHATILGNALGFQNFLVKPLCNNLPLWSISNEVVYYFAFPVMVAALARGFSTGVVISLAGIALIFILSLALTPLDDTTIVLDFPYWLIGMALWFLPKDFPRGRWLAWPMLVAALLFGRFEVAKNLFWLRDLFLAASFSYLLAGFFDRPMPQAGIGKVAAAHVANGSRWFADLSFSLYVTHYPLIKLYSYFALNPQHHGARYSEITPRIVLEFIGLGAFCVLVAFGFSLLFERPRAAFKRAIVRRLRISGTSPVA